MPLHKRIPGVGLAWFPRGACVDSVGFRGSRYERTRFNSVAPCGAPWGSGGLPVACAGFGWASVELASAAKHLHIWQLWGRIVHSAFEAVRLLVVALCRAILEWYVDEFKGPLNYRTSFGSAVFRAQAFHNTWLLTPSRVAQAGRIFKEARVVLPFAVCECCDFAWGVPLLGPLLATALADETSHGRP